MIELKDVYKTYRIGNQNIHALNGVTLKIDDGDFVVIMGPSGSGKSTLMHLMGLLDVPDAGSIRVDGIEASGFSEDDLAKLRREMTGFVFQQFNLLPRMTAAENVQLPLMYSGRQADREKTDSLLRLVSLQDRVFHKSNELSGGQQQRVAIARSLINDPKMILADEPTGNLDSKSAEEILTLMKELNSKGITIVLVTHEEEIGLQAKRLIRMRDGKIQNDKRILPISKISEAGKKTILNKEESRLSWNDIKEYSKQGTRALRANKIRTGLSMLGILIGVAALIAMLALGRGAQKAIEAQLESLGSNLLVLTPGAPRVRGVAKEAGANTRLTQEDAAALKDQLPQIEEAASMVDGRGQVVFENKNWSTEILGATPAFPSLHASVPDVGRFFTEAENQSRSRVVVIGTTVRKELFGDRNPIGEYIKIRRDNFEVIGILPKKGSKGWRDQDDIVIIPIQTAMYRIFGKKYVDSIDLKVSSTSALETMQSTILNRMIARHHVPPSQREDAFQVHNMAEIQAALSESSRTMAMLLATIASISLLVGGIGIMNIMLVSVTERTKEIGLRKAIGAQKGAILSQFLTEAAVLCAFGGLLGVFFGWLITKALSSIAGWDTVITASSVALALFFSALIGIVFGIYPARKAAQMNPIEALRYE